MIFLHWVVCEGWAPHFTLWLSFSVSCIYYCFTNFLCLSLVLLYSYFQFSFRFSYIFLVTSFAVYGVHALLRICFVLRVDQKALQCRLRLHGCHNSSLLEYPSQFLWKSTHIGQNHHSFTLHIILLLVSSLLLYFLLHIILNVRACVRACVRDCWREGTGVNASSWWSILMQVLFMCMYHCV